jgi:hypothetical protein
MAVAETSVMELCRQLRISRVTLYRYVGPKGELRPDGKKLLANQSSVNTTTD